MILKMWDASIELPGKVRAVICLIIDKFAAQKGR
ncbi:MAG: hypothetical protein PWR20_1706 [Bacteroidales bacterium]|jgi:hypothetical protein|nr:hypothetical protein [Bacteroidales bacterium]MDN5328525.1 hypothetical protein [Bacteroidales bacterium]